VLNRTIGNTASGYVSALIAGERTIALHAGLTFGLAIGVVTAVASAFTPFIEWAADHLPERRMGVLGVALILFGFALQSVQYWVALLDIPILTK
jgi:hypothetical protein